MSQKMATKTIVQRVLVIALLTIFAGTGILVANFETPGADEAIDGDVKKISSFSDGSLLLLGDFSHGPFIKLNSDLTVDGDFLASFDKGYFNGDIHDFVINKDDSIIVVGDFTVVDQSLAGSIVKLNKNGETDTQFIKNTGTGFDGPLYTIAKNTAGKLVVSGDINSFNGKEVSRLVYLSQSGKEPTYNDNFKQKMALRILASDDGSMLFFNKEEGSNRMVLEH